MFSTTFEGCMELEAVPADFTERMAQRVEEGLLYRGSRRRANYSVRHLDRASIHFGADDALTGFNIGLNEVVLRRVDEHRISCRVDYGRWARFATYLSLAVTLPLAIVLLIPQVHKVFTGNPILPYALWGMVLFWGVVWPWMLGRMHRVSAAHCLERVVREVCAGQEAACVAAPGARRYRSAAQILGIPLVSIAMGPDPTSDQLRGVAKGFVAIGDVAVGVVAIGGVAVGGVALGGLAIGGCARWAALRWAWLHWAVSRSASWPLVAAPTAS
jgi:hypothetical protein